MYKLNLHIIQAIAECFNLFSIFKLSNYLTLVDAKNKPVVLNIDNKPCFFTFDKHHFELNIGNKKNDFTFFEKMYISGVLPPNCKWVNMTLISYYKLLIKYIAIEPRNFYLNIKNGKIQYSILYNDSIFNIQNITT